MPRAVDDLAYRAEAIEAVVAPTLWGDMWQGHTMLLTNAEQILHLLDLLFVRER
ncbi:MAG: hypothetical protein SF029_04645 [bacterium]|nr:hypothetical protein [bacterium]